jgi:hypothetical protein
MTAMLCHAPYGRAPQVKTSTARIPNDHTSVWNVKIWWTIALRGWKGKGGAIECKHAWRGLVKSGIGSRRLRVGLRTPQRERAGDGASGFHYERISPWVRPPQRHDSRFRYSVVLVADASSQPKVRDLGHLILIEQNVARCEISVHHSHRSDKCHANSDTVQDSQKCTSIAGVVSNVLSKLSHRTQFHYKEVRRSGRHHTIRPDHVDVNKLPSDCCFFHKCGVGDGGGISVLLLPDELDCDCRSRSYSAHRRGEVACTDLAKLAGSKDAI